MSTTAENARHVRGYLMAPRVPEGLAAVVEGLTREVLRHRPEDIYAFAARHFEELLRVRERRDRASREDDDSDTLRELNARLRKREAGGERRERTRSGWSMDETAKVLERYRSVFGDEGAKMSADEVRALARDKENLAFERSRSRSRSRTSKERSRQHARRPREHHRQHPPSKLDGGKAVPPSPMPSLPGSTGLLAKDIKSELRRNKRNGAERIDRKRVEDRSSERSGSMDDDSTRVAASRRTSSRRSLERARRVETSARENGFCESSARKSSSRAPDMDRLVKEYTTERLAGVDATNYLEKVQEVIDRTAPVVREKVAELKEVARSKRRRSSGSRDSEIRGVDLSNGLDGNSPTELQKDTLEARLAATRNLLEDVSSATSQPERTSRRDRPRSNNGHERRPSTSSESRSVQQLVSLPAVRPPSAKSSKDVGRNESDALVLPPISPESSKSSKTTGDLVLPALSSPNGSAASRRETSDGGPEAPENSSTKDGDRNDGPENSAGEAGESTGKSAMRASQRSDDEDICRDSLNVTPDVAETPQRPDSLEPQDYVAEAKDEDANDREKTSANELIDAEEVEKMRNATRIGQTQEEGEVMAPVDGNAVDDVPPRNDIVDKLRELEETEKRIEGILDDVSKDEENVSVKKKLQELKDAEERIEGMLVHESSKNVLDDAKTKVVVEERGPREEHIDTIENLDQSESENLDSENVASTPKDEVEIISESLISPQGDEMAICKVEDVEVVASKSPEGEGKPAEVPENVVKRSDDSFVLSEGSPCEIPESVTTVIIPERTITSPDSDTLLVEVEEDGEVRSTLVTRKTPENEAVELKSAIEAFGEYVKPEPVETSTVDIDFIRGIKASHDIMLARQDLEHIQEEDDKDVEETGSSMEMDEVRELERHTLEHISENEDNESTSLDEVEKNGNVANVEDVVKVQEAENGENVGKSPEAENVEEEKIEKLEIVQSGQLEGVEESTITGNVKEEGVEGSVNVQNVDLDNVEKPANTENGREINTQESETVEIDEEGKLEKPAPTGHSEDQSVVKSTNVLNVEEAIEEKPTNTENIVEIEREKRSIDGIKHEEIQKIDTPTVEVEDEDIHETEKSVDVSNLLENVPEEIGIVEQDFSKTSADSNVIGAAKETSPPVDVNDAGDLVENSLEAEESTEVRSTESTNEAKETSASDRSSASLTTDPERPVVPELNLDSLQDITVSSFKMTDEETKRDSEESRRTASLSEQFASDENKPATDGNVADNDKSLTEGDGAEMSSTGTSHLGEPRKDSATQMEREKENDLEDDVHVAVSEPNLNDPTSKDEINDVASNGQADENTKKEEEAISSATKDADISIDEEVARENTHLPLEIPSEREVTKRGAEEKSEEEEKERGERAGSLESTERESRETGTNGLPDESTEGNGNERLGSIDSRKSTEPKRTDSSDEEIARELIATHLADVERVILAKENPEEETTDKPATSEGVSAECSARQAGSEEEREESVETVTTTMQSDGAKMESGEESMSAGTKVNDNEEDERTEEKSHRVKSLTKELSGGSEVEFSVETQKHLNSVDDNKTEPATNGKTAPASPRGTDGEESRENSEDREVFEELKKALDETDNAENNSEVTSSSPTEHPQSPQSGNDGKADIVPASSEVAVDSERKEIDRNSADVEKRKSDLEESASVERSSATNGESDASSLNSAATRIQAGVRGFLTRRHLRGGALKRSSSVQDDHTPVELSASSAIESRESKSREGPRREDASRGVATTTTTTTTTKFLAEPFATTGLQHTGEFHDCLPLPVLEPTALANKLGNVDGADRNDDDVDLTESSSVSERDTTSEDTTNISTRPTDDEQVETIERRDEISPDGGIFLAETGIPVLRLEMHPSVDRFLDFLAIAKNESSLEDGYLNFITSVEDIGPEVETRAENSRHDDATDEGSNVWEPLAVTGPPESLVIEELVSLEEPSVAGTSGKTSGDDAGAKSSSRESSDANRVPAASEEAAANEEGSKDEGPAGKDSPISLDDEREFLEGSPISIGDPTTSRASSAKAGDASRRGENPEIARREESLVKQPDSSVIDGSLPADASLSSLSFSMNVDDVLGLGAEGEKLIARNESDSRGKESSEKRDAEVSGDDRLEKPRDPSPPVSATPERDNARREKTARTQETDSPRGKSSETSDASRMEDLAKSTD